MSAGPFTESEIREWCAAELRKTIDDAAVTIGPDVTFSAMGLDSASSAFFVVELEDWLGLELSPDLVFEYPTIGELARYLVARQSGGGNAAG